MRTTTLSAIAVLASGLQQVVATGWRNAAPFSCPSKGSDNCIPAQYPGFDWSDLPTGNFGSYKDFQFSGFTCQNSFDKRDALVGRTFQSKCISGTASSEPKNSPKISCGGSKSVDAFNIDYFQVTVNFDTELEFHYTMKDNSICKQKSSCQVKGTTISNTQCGGATGVTIVFPPKGGKKSCGVGVHGIKFHCPTSSLTSKMITSTLTPTLPASSSTTTPAEVTTEGPQSSTSSTSSAYLNTLSSTSGIAPSSSSVASSSSSVAVSVSIPGVPSTTSESSPTTTPIVSVPVDYTTVVTVVTDVTVTTCPVTNTHISSGTTSIEITQTISTITVTNTNTITTCTKCNHVPTTAPAGPSAAPSSSVPAVGPSSTGAVASSAGPIGSSSAVSTASASSAGPIDSSSAVSASSSNSAGPSATGSASSVNSAAQSSTGGPSSVAPSSAGITSVAAVSTSASSPSGTPSTPYCPEILPQCLNTWLPSTCTSNTDIECFCPSSNFTSLVFDCLKAHGASASDITSAASYLQGICSAYIPQNPGLITDCPKPKDNSTSPITGPLTTVTIAATVTVPCSTGTASYSTTTISTVATIPQVVLQTTGSSIGVVPGTAAPAVTTPAAPTSVLATPTQASAGFTATAKPQFVNAASRSSVSLGMAGAMIMAAVAAL